MPAAPLLLAACLLAPAGGGRTLTYPADRTVGTLFVRPVPVDGQAADLSYFGGGWEELGPALGTVDIPAGSLVRWDAAGNLGDLTFLADLPADALWGVRFGPSAVGDGDLGSLAQLTGLIYLDLSGTAATEATLTTLAPLDRLETLRFDFPLSDDGAERLRKLPALRTAGGPLRLSARGVAAVAALPKLERLSLIGDGVTDAALAPVGEMRALRYFQVQDAPVTDAAVERLAGIETLEELSVSGTRVSGDSIASLGRLPRLRSLSLGFGGPGDAYRGDRPTLEGVAECRGLRSLVLTGGGLGPDDFADLVNLTGLTFLEVWDVPFTDEAAYHVAALRSLTHLSAQGASVSDVGLGSLASLPDLERVLIRGPITRAGLLRLAELPKLEMAYVSSPYMSGADGESLREAAASLTTLKLPPYRVLTRDGFAVPYAADGFRRAGGDTRPAELDALEGEPAPPLTVENRHTADGEPVTLADLRGKVVLLDFWGTWCGPCLASFPELKELRERFGPGGFEIVGVHTTVRAGTMADYLKENPLPWPNAADADGLTVAAYGVRSYPGVYLIDRTGALRFADLHRPDLTRAVEMLIAENRDRQGVGPSGGGVGSPVPTP